MKIKEGDPWHQERRMLNRWALCKLHDDERSIMRYCGLTWAGSPRALMAPIYERGATKREDATGYARELPQLPDHIPPQVDEFMLALLPILPAAHAALLARHCRIVHGEHVEAKSEVWLAQTLYCKSRTRSHVKLIEDCNQGYEALRRWLDLATCQQAARVAAAG